MSEEMPEINKPEKPDNRLRNSLKGWMEDKALGFYYLICGLIGVAMLLTMGLTMRMEGSSFEFYYLIGSILLILTILGIINYKSKK